MNCDNLNGISNGNCEMSIGGISKVFIFPFDDISQYTYTNDDLNYVTGYSSLSLPILYKPNQLSSEYTGNKSERNYKLYDHQLTLNFLKMDRQKREEIKNLSNMDLTVIFQDRNGTCWIMGQHVPVRLSTNQVGTGVKDSINGYEITLVSQEKEQLKEIECVSEGCFASFTAREFKRTTFVIPNADDYGWDYIETDVNGILITKDLSSLQALEPSEWNNDPVILAHDRQVLLDLFSSANGVVTNLITTYDDIAEEVVIAVESTDTNYGTFQVDNTVFNKDSYLATLTLNTVLSQAIASSTTIIEVRDSTNAVVYSTGYGLSVSNGTTITGTSDNATLVMSTLYPTGTTLTVQLTNVPCNNVVYNYTFNNTLEACDLLMDFSFGKDLRTKIHVPYLTSGGSSSITQRYQNTTVDIQGISFQLYKNYTDWHDDFNTFVNDITLLFYQVNLPIDLNSLSFSDTGTGVDISFNINNILLDLRTKQQVVGYDENYLFDDWKQGRALNIQTIAPLGSVITHNDQTGNQMIGENFINITYNDFDLAYNSAGNISVDNVSILWSLDSTVPYGPNDNITTTSLGGNCNTPTLIKSFAECYDDFSSDYDSNFQLLTLDCSSPASINMGNSYEFITNDGSSNTTNTFTLPTVVTPSNNIHYLIDRLNSIRGMEVIHYDFDALSREYRLFFKIDLGSSIVSLQDVVNSRYFTLGSISQIFKNTTTTSINPYNELSWVLPTNLLSSTTTSLPLSEGYWQLEDTTTNAVIINWSDPNDQLTINKPAGVDNDVTISLHEDYPTSSNQVLFDLLVSGVSSKTVTNVSGILSGNGSALNKVNYISYTNNLGWRQVQPIDLTLSGSETIFKELTQTPVIWGTSDNINYVGSQTSTQPTVTTSISGC